MKYQLIMLPNPILVSDEQAKPGGYDYSVNYNTVTSVDAERYNTLSLPAYKGMYKKVIAGIEGLPKLDLSAIAEEIGWVDVEKLAITKFGDGDYAAEAKMGFKYGFKAAQSLNEKKFSEEDMINWAMFYYKHQENSTEYWGKDLFKIWQSLSQPKAFDVEVEMKTKCYCGHTDWCECSENEGSKFIEVPKITNNSIKILKVL